MLPRLHTVLALVATVVAAASAAEPGAQLEALARARFGALGAGELAVVRGAPARELVWVGTDTDYGAPSNDTTRAETWGPERTVRADLVRWLYADPVASGMVHPSGLGIGGARIEGTLDFSYLRTSLPLTLVRCWITGGVDTSYAKLQSLEVRGTRSGAVVGEQTELAGDLSFRYGVHERVNLFRARIGGNVDLSGTSFDGGATTVNLVQSTIGGDVVLHDGFTTNGLVDVRLARIGQSLSLHDVTFTGTDDTGLVAERATIGGPLYWVQVRHTPQTALDLENAKAGALWDDEASWPAPGKLTLDGFVYDGIDGGPADAAHRLRWLGLQAPGYLPQPYRQLGHVLAESGRETEATDVRIAKEEMRRRDGGLGAADRAWSWVLDVTIGYGYRPLRALWWIALFVAVGTLLFGLGYRARLVAPVDEAAYAAFAATGTPPPHYPSFHALVYALENFLPVVELHQGEYWRPSPHRAVATTVERSVAGLALRWYLWLHILAGWALTPLLFAGLSGLVHPD